MSMRVSRLFLIVAALLFVAALPAAAQQAKPPVLQPIPEPPPPPPGYELDSAIEPQVTILKRGTDTVEEYRIGGKLYMIKVTPPNGKPYYMIDHKGDGTFMRQDNFDSGIKVPSPLWSIM